MTIYNSDIINIHYNAAVDRADISRTNSNLPLTSIALFQLTNDPTCFESFKAFFLKTFTWSWIVVKDSQGNDTNQIVNINSVAHRTGLSVKQVKDANKVGNLYETIANTYNQADPIQPSPVKLAALQEKKRIGLEDRLYNIDESSDVAFLNSLEAYFRSDSHNLGVPEYLGGVDVIYLGAIFADFATATFPDRVRAKAWINDELIVDRFNMVRIECRQLVIDKACEEIDALYS